MKKFISSCLALLAALASTAALAQGTPLGAIPRSTSPTPTLGLYVHVIDGLVNLRNQGGTTSFAPGQFGFTPSFTTPPAPIPRAPVILFTPPPAFSILTSGSGSGAPKSNTVDCEVR
jgi:hypothetical protein